MKDTFTPGQWLKGRIYERRCDLSPDGLQLLYFASDQRRKTSSWISISRPPYFTALAFWPKGNSYGGGGLFDTNDQIRLDYVEWESLSPSVETPLPKWLRVERIVRKSWEEYSLCSPWIQRLQRDGWKISATPTGTKDERGRAMLLELDPPLTLEREHPKFGDEAILRMRVLGHGRSGNSGLIIEYEVELKDSDLIPLERCEWADWSATGHLLAAKAGCLYRCKVTPESIDPMESTTQIADFNGMTFERVLAPPETLEWPRQRKKK